MAKRRTPTPEQAWLADLPDAYLDCRMMGHADVDYTYRPDGRAHVITLSCSRCKRRRTFRLGAGLTREGRSRPNYSDAEGYLAPRGSGRADRRAIAARWVDHLGRLVDSPL